ncbi:N-acetylmuramoyl-L-alanine amidase [Nostoc sp. FACHB-87]|uniref:N-acetylmuramoyl-L-alanine amidase n=1 Tax=Nostocaceae TaxID=1162 RepID=UPI0016897590|nr:MULTISPECIES: N-acetylmuramoyl-L-alanine amidase [Nostocaceae]MBD2459357.1 N-acetylmuramoyl-L-alanine amidase [Nostoc sp. FACHB-87]MBD2480350.1 N-acetylmuramoyl-L-alanine amidase [Anabaena sp. FACHB-83]
MSELFNQLVKTYAEKSIDFPQLKEITIAQWLLESGKGTSLLATKHFNFGGLKWRDEMTEFAVPVDYEASDGLDKYCKFNSLEAFINGYWRFLERSPYEGWRNNASSPEAFIAFIAPIYAGDRNYVTKVLNVYAEAKKLLADIEHTDHHHPGTAEAVNKPPIKAFIESPNQSSRAGADIDTIVVHYTTAGTAQSSINHFKNPASEVSAHYIIDKNGDIYQMVKDSDKAWHAARANRTSIGIEHVAKQGERLTEAQEKSSVHLIKWLMTEYKIPKENIIAHKQVLSTSCPGNIFGDAINDNNIPKFKAWVAKNFSNDVIPASVPLSPSGLGIYIVQPGDTLSAIGDRHDISLDKLLELNPSIQNPDLILPGQRIMVTRVDGDDDLIITTSRPLNLPITIAEFQLNSSNYQTFSHSLLGNITITGGYMEPEGHSLKPEQKAIFLDKTLKTLAPSNRNIGIDYVVSDRKVKAWYGGTVTKRGREGGYGRRVHIQLDVIYEFGGKKYQVYQAFAHLQEILVSVGQVVGQGEQIAIMGGSGASSDSDYPLHVDLSTYLFMNGSLVQINPQVLDEQLI